MKLRSDATKFILVIHDDGIDGEWTVTMTRMLNGYSSATTTSETAPAELTPERVAAVVAEMFRLEEKRAAA
jgi:hypothetical protein